LTVCWVFAEDTARTAAAMISKAFRIQVLPTAVSANHV
jgi:hypothetical protein